MLEKMKKHRSRGPKLPHAPPINRSFEDFEKCHRKASFPSRSAAKAARILPNGKILFPYRCQICLRWHLTTDSRRQQMLAAEKLNIRGMS